MASEFTEQELRIIEQIGKGRSAKQIADKLGVKEDTVRDHVDTLKQRLGAASQEELPARFAQVTGWANQPTRYA